MVKILLNFATPNFYSAQQFNAKTGVNIGGFDRVICANPDLIDAHFKQNYIGILEQSRGAGYWLWKPYFILQTLDALQDGDLLMYADAGSHFIKSAELLLDLPNKFNQDVIPFELELPEYAWTKRDTFVLMGADDSGYESSHQYLASFIVIRKSSISTQFTNEYLNYCCNPNILTDLPNICGLPNYKDFQEHRHDQSVFSLLCKKYQLKGFRDPSQWGNSRAANYLNSNYPQILEHTRSKSPKQAKPLYKLKRFFLPK